jgi:hypothetical protein
MNIGKLLKTKLINTKRPPTDRYFPFQLLNFPFQLLSFFPIRSSIISQSLLFNFLKCIGIPRYLNAYDPFLHPKSCSYCGSNSLACPKQKISLLWKLIFRPDNSLKALRSSFIFLAFSRLCSINKIVSFAY